MFKPETRFLVVDDFFSMRKIIKNALAELGYTNVVEADDGVSALKILNDAKGSTPIDFIFSDWNMPQMTGFELLKECRKDEDFKKIPFVMVTAEGEQKQILDAIKNGCTEYIIKPFAPAIIKEKVTRVYTKLNAPKAA